MKIYNKNMCIYTFKLIATYFPSGEKVWATIPLIFKCS